MKWLLWMILQVWICAVGIGIVMMQAALVEAGGRVQVTPRGLDVVFTADDLVLHPPVAPECIQPANLPPPIRLQDGTWIPSWVRPAECSTTNYALRMSP